MSRAFCRDVPDSWGLGVFARNHFSLNFCHVVSDVVRTWFGCGSDVVRMWFGCVFGSGADSLAEVKGKWFPAGVFGKFVQKKLVRIFRSLLKRSLRCL